MRRLERFETLALDFEGVDHVFAMQAGREVRVVVDPGVVDDLGARTCPRIAASRRRPPVPRPDPGNRDPGVPVD